MDTYSNRYELLPSISYPHTFLKQAARCNELIYSQECTEHTPHVGNVTGIILKETEAELEPFAG